MTTTVKSIDTSKPLRMQFKGNIDKTTEDLIVLARKRGQAIELWDARNNRQQVILTVTAQGDVADVMVPPLKVPMMELIAQHALDHGPKAMARAMQFARQYDYEERRTVHGG